MTSIGDLRDDLRAKYGSPVPPQTSVAVSTDAGDLALERAFVVTGKSGRTVITAPIREIASTNEGFLYRLAVSIASLKEELRIGVTFSLTLGLVE